MRYYELQNQFSDNNLALSALTVKPIYSLGSTLLWSLRLDIYLYHWIKHFHQRLNQTDSSNNGNLSLSEPHRQVDRSAMRSQLN